MAAVETTDEEVATGSNPTTAAEETAEVEIGIAPSATTQTSPSEPSATGAENRAATLPPNHVTTAGASAVTAGTIVAVTDSAHKGRGRDDRRGGGDWDCPKCNNSNFSFRTECNRCGEPRGDARGAPRNDRRSGFDRRNNDRRGGFDRRGGRDGSRGGFDRRGGRDGNRGGYEAKPGDWTCNDCGANNFASRTSCYKCGPDAQNRGGDRRGGDRRGPRQSRGFGGGDRRGGDRRGPREPRNFGGGDRRGPRQDRDFRNEGRGDGDRRGGDRRGPRQDRGNGGKSRIRPKGPFRQARGKSGGHAHNRGPKPIRRTRRDDD